jgi:CheY-like chemotaxis protein
VVKRAEKIAQAGERCARIVRNFLALARQHPPERRRVSLNQIVEQALELLAYPLRVDGVQVVRELDPELPPLQADPHQLHQVLVNLISNAHHAMRETPSPRQLTVRTRGDHESGRVCLDVADSGPGIAPEVVSRIFEPFFTTKPAGQGTGLGLSLCQGIIESHHGTIRVDTTVAPGTMFRVELPLGTPDVRGETPGPVATAGARGKTILVVDDETEVAGVLADLLTLDGNRVETATNGLVALEKMATAAFDLVMSDVKMPELDGLGLYRELARRDAGWRQRFILLTGDTLNLETAAFLEGERMPSLSKPFLLEEVRRVVGIVTGAGA